MATVRGVTVVVGDWLRCDADDWEGQVTEVDTDTVTLRMNLGGLRVVPADQTTWNWWDGRAVTS